MWSGTFSSFRPGSVIALNAGSIGLLVYIVLASIGARVPTEGRSQVQLGSEGLIKWKGISDADRPLAEAVAAIAVDNTIIVSLVNSGYLDFAENWMISISRQGFGDRVLLFAEDQEAFDHIDSRWPGHVITYNYSSIPRAGESAHDFGSLGFFLMTERRPDYLRAVLRLGVNVLYNDLDMVWLKNPFPAFSGAYDVWVNDDWTDDTGHAAVRPLQPDRRFPSHYHPNICSCLLYMRPTAESYKLLDTWAGLMSLKDWKPPIQDQPFFNKALNMLKGLKVGILPQRQFPAGCLFFADSVWREAFGDEAALVHNNWIVGHDVKRQRFQNLGIWYVKEDKEANGTP